MSHKEREDHFRLPKPTMTLNLPAREMDVLNKIAAEMDMNKTAVMRQALRLYELVRERHKQGYRLAFKDENGIIEVDVIGGCIGDEG